MVNSSYLHSEQTRSDSFTSSEINPATYQTDNYLQKSVNSFFCSEPSNVARMQQTPEFSDLTSVKSNPQYMDVDAFYPISSRVLSHVMAENPNQERLSLNHEHSRQSAPRMERQYSINTVMEVIENHDINDVSSCKPPQFQSPKPQQTQPISIQRPLNTQPDPNSFSPPQATYLAPPASDLREHPDRCSLHGGSVSSSPGSVSYASYPENFPNGNGQLHSHAHSYCGEGFSMQPQTGEITLMSQNPFSPCQSDTSSPMFVFGPDHSKGGAAHQVFTFDDSPGQFKPSHSCPDLNSVDQQRATEVYTPHSNGLPGPSGQPDSMGVYSPQTHPNARYLPDYHFLTHEKGVKLEEVDSSSVFEDLQQDSSITEQERADRRRIRNNLACRASRERRKKRKMDQEALAQYLAEKNRKLKEQIRQLEEAVVIAHDDVRRRMSHS